MDFNYAIITDTQDIPDILASLERQPFISLDLETTGFDPYRNHIHGISLATDSMAWYVTLGAEKTIIPPLLELTQKIPVVGHNIKFDYSFLHQYGKLPPISMDTMVAQALIDENQALGLKPLSQVKLGIRDKLPGFEDLLREYKPIMGRRILGDMNIYDLPINEVGEYAARDARLNYDLWLVTANELEREGYTKQFTEIEMPFMYVLLNMELRGIWLDMPLLLKLERELKAGYDESLKNFLKLTGDLNPNSPKQLVKFFYEDLGFTPTRFTKKKNGPAVDSLALIRLSKQDKSGAAQALLDFRNYDKLLNTYVTPFIEKQFMGRLHGRFNQTGAVTGRLSSSEPNLQNIPTGDDNNGTKIRALFAAPEGRILVDPDYSQLELRILAHYTKDARLMEVFNTGGDPHQMTADLVRCSRRDAKTVNFARIYGSGVNTIADTIEESTGERPNTKDVRNWLKSYDEEYPAVPATIRKVIHKARETGYIRTIAGRKRRVPDINSDDNDLRSRAERQVFNALIQGSASDIMKKSMLDIDKIQDSYDAGVEAQVHDELLFEVPEEPAKEFGGKVQEIMESAGDYFGLRVKLEAKPGFGRNWAEAKG